MDEEKRIEEDIELDSNKSENSTPNKKEEEHNKILSVALIIMGVVLAGMLSFYFYNQSLNRISDDGFVYDVIKGKSVTFYHTSFVIYDKAKPINYNVYLRTDPRILNEIEFEGEMNRREMLVVNNTDSFGCGGKGVIALANMNQILKAVGITSIIDQNATCDENGWYTMVDIQPGNVTKIEKYGPSCYKIYVKDCEILQGTERYIVEVLKDSDLLNKTKN